HGLRMGGADEHLSSTARFHRWPRRSGLAARGPGAAPGPRAAHRRAPGGSTKTIPRRSVAPPLPSTPLPVHSSATDLGWTDGRNVRTDLRWAGADANRMRALAHILAGSTPATVALPAGDADDPDRLCARGRAHHQRRRPAPQPRADATDARPQRRRGR